MPSAEPRSPEGEPDYRYTLANERTFLAYQRTSIGLVAASLAVFNLLEEEWAVRLLGALLLLAGVVGARGGCLRDPGGERAIRAGVAVAAPQTAHPLAIAVLICVVAAALSVVVGA